MAKVDIKDIEKAQDRIKGHIIHSPLINAGQLSRKLGHDILLKLEFLQETGSFKLRGATNAMLSLKPGERQFGVVTASSGNHGPALALAATRLGVNSTICLSNLVPQNKILNVSSNGGTVCVEGQDYDESLEVCMQLVKDNKMHLVHPFDNPSVVAGAGTIGLELAEDASDVDCILVPLSGGGLLAGIAVALKARRSKASLIGVTMENGASMIQSLKAGKPIDVKEVETIADALGGNIGLDNNWTFETVRDLVDDCVTVSDDQIKEAMRILFYSEGMMVEGAAAVGVAALMSGTVDCKGRAICLLSGRNIAAKTFLDVISQKP